VLIHPSLGNVFREAMSISQMDMDVGDDLILCWEWISSHYLQNLFQAGQVGLWSGQDQLQLALLPTAARHPPAALSMVIRHRELRRLLRQIVRDDAPALSTAIAVTPPASPPGPLGAHSTGWSRQVLADHAEVAVLEATERQAARERRHHGGPAAWLSASTAASRRGSRSSAKARNCTSRRSTWRTRSCASQATTSRRRPGLRSAQGRVRGRAWRSTARATAGLGLAAGAGHGARPRDGGRANAAVAPGEAAV
jgi:hypothetical protein